MIRSVDARRGGHLQPRLAEIEQASQSGPLGPNRLRRNNHKTKEIIFVVAQGEWPPSCLWVGAQFR
jgi:hypothetical protein